MNDTKSPPPAIPEPGEAPFPEYSASGRPVRTADRIAFTVWTTGVLIVLAFSFLMYILGWVI